MHEKNIAMASPHMYGLPRGSVEVANFTSYARGDGSSVDSGGNASSGSVLDEIAPEICQHDFACLCIPGTEIEFDPVVLCSQAVVWELWKCCYRPPRLDSCIIT